MFTGLIETVGKIAGITKKTNIIELSISSSEISSELAVGDSVSISGVCLTVTRISSGSFIVSMIPETWHRTTLGSSSAGYEVNLERALPVSGRLDGHIVSGHVDGVAEVIEVVKDGRSSTMTFKAESSLLEHMVPKGSIAIEGVSLTLIDVSSESFSVGIIPTTLKVTTLGTLKKGDHVNIETDILAKYVYKSIKRLTGSTNPDTENADLTWDKLAGYGWTS